MAFFTGSPEIRKNVSSLQKQQKPIFNQLTNAAQQGEGGAFGKASDYYSGLLSDENQDYNDFSAPALRQYQEDIVPGLSEQFAGMGAGGLSSSGFRNAQIQGATDLSERLGSLRAQLRQQGAQGLQNIGQLGLGDYSQPTTTQQGTQGFLSQIAPAAGSAIGAAIGSYGGPAGIAAGATAGNSFGNWIGGNNSGNNVGANTSGYQSNNIPASPQMQGGGKYGLPNFMNGR